MTSPPDGSRENPAMTPDTVAADEEAADGSGDNPAMIPDRGTSIFNALVILCQAAEMVRKRDAQKLYEEQAAQLTEYQRQAVRDFAIGLHSDLHSDESPKIVPKQRKEEDDEVKGKGKSPFKEAKDAIEKRRRDSISTTTSTSTTTSSELNLTTLKEAPTLMDLCMRVLADNSEAITSLNLVPDHLRKKLSNLVSSKGKVDTRFMQLLIQDSPSEIYASNCVDIEEKDLTQILCDCDRVSLKVLNLDLCGRAMTESCITEFLKRSPNGFPSLTTLSLQGAFCFTDNALALISRSAPLLRLIDLSYCSYLTSVAVMILADSFGSTLRGLNIDGCQGIKPSYIFMRSLSKFEKLNYLSVAGLDNIHDVFVAFITTRGSNLTHLSLASCKNLSDGTIWTVGRCCPNLEALDISELDDLTDQSLKEITDGCRSLNSVKFTRNRFSDEAVAAFLEVSGGSLNQLCLDHVRDVGQETAISLAKNCKRLRYLDLSWCRKLTEEELKRILNCCSLLRSLKLFGWTQVRDEFLEELSRLQLRIVGLKMTSLFAHLDDSYPSVDAKFF